MWRPAQPSDDESIFRMSAALYREDPSPDPVPDTHIRQTLAKLREHPVRGLAVVLEHAGAIRGYALLISFWSNERGGEICYLDEIYVEKEARSQGCGRKLVEALASRNSLWPGKAVAIDLEVSPKNTRARALYES